MSSKRRIYILSMCSVLLTVFIFILLRYTSILGSYFNAFHKISLKDTVLGKFDTDIAFNEYSKAIQTPEFTKEEFVFMAKSYYCISKIPRKVLVNYFLNVYNEFLLNSSIVKSPEKVKFLMPILTETWQVAFNFIFSNFIAKIYANFVTNIMNKFNTPRNSNDLLMIKLLQKYIGTLDTSFNSLLEDDLKSKLTERKLKKESLMLSYIEETLIEIIPKSKEFK
ncbi:hypothetical protein AAJ76_4600026961 [Vairimorpha ceranae]|uniref:Uncharacterized protein n=1 Tax=Vairimorpha ceranae TaxID=40302 RepID=A0A0F9ZAD5_9MICR|nr:hypothetical protein AAJ76_4600026961 [Vairimorpha ceranae]KAF5140802.1 hypothetical protein G9O61_00g010330 [Vairimorpha ceranae]KKO74779.1 hypothetical protein AAJ76_4600026961 [Vairimorpha ceranae]